MAPPTLSKDNASPKPRRNAGAGSRRLKRDARGKPIAGVFELRVYVQWNPRTGKPGTISRTFRGGAKAADKRIRELLDEYSQPEVGVRDTRFSALLEEWLRDIKRQGRSPLTLREYRRLIDKTIAPALGTVPLDALTGHDLDVFYGELQERGLAAGSIRQVHAIVRAACRQGIRWSWLKVNPADAATPPKPSRTPQKAPSSADVLQLIRAAEEEDSQLAVFISLAASTGARRGELLGLVWGDVDWEKRTLTIERSVAVLEKGETTYKETKTSQVRRIAIDGFAIGALRAQRKELGAIASDAGVELEDETPIFTYDLERPISPDTVTHYVRNLSRRLKIPTHLQALRHFAATEMIAGGIDVRTVAGRLGHSDATTTLRTYAHVLPQRDRDAARMLGGTLSR